MQYTLVRSNRKTIAILVDRQGLLTVRAPKKLSAAQIDAFVQEKRAWVEKIRARLAALPPPTPSLSLTDGATLPYLGQTLTLQRADVRRVCLRGSTLLVPQTAADLQPVLRWLDTQAREQLAARAQQTSLRLSLFPKSLRFTHAKGRWGSMSGRGTLSLNQALLFCPPAVIEYVLVHELCHIPHPNHSPAFWQMVGRCMPEYQVHRQWLKTHASLISFLPD